MSVIVYDVLNVKLTRTCTEVSPSGSRSSKLTEQFHLAANTLYNISYNSDQRVKFLSIICRSATWIGSSPYRISIIALRRRCDFFGTTNTKFHQRIQA